jgi:DNA-binding transcriptional LysR family regulator
MDTKKLHHFKVLVETGHLRKASELLNISHAGLSKSVRTLEEELGVDLTSKDGRNLRITPAGMKLIEKIDACLMAEERLLSSLKQGDISPSINIGTFEVFSTYLSPLLLSSIGEQAKINFIELAPNNLEQALIDDQIDFGITYLPIPKTQLDHLEITTIKMGVFGSEKWKNSSTPLEKLPFVIPTSEIIGTPTKVKGLDGWPEGEVYRHIQYKVSLMETALSLVRQGFAVAYLPRFVVELHNQFVRKEFHIYELKKPSTINDKQPIYAVKRKERGEDVPFKALCKVLRKLK